MKFIDSHCHIDFPDFDKDRDDIWRACLSRGISSLLIPGVEPNQWARAKCFSEKFEGMHFSVGLHPWWISSVVGDEKSANVQHFAKLEKLLAPFASSSRCIAIGECGLDKNQNVDFTSQESVLEAHLLWCKTYELPVILHCHKSHAEMLRLLKRLPPERGGVVHAFSGSEEIAREYIRLGFYLGAGGVITYERANKTRQTFKRIPIERILLETDAPDMPLEGEQGKRNSPINVVRVAEALAQLRGESLENISRQTSDNFSNLFRVQ